MTLSGQVADLYLEKLWESISLCQCLEYNFFISNGAIKLTRMFIPGEFGPLKNNIVRVELYKYNQL